MSQVIDPIVFEAVEGKPLPAGHPAKMFAASLSGQHPARRLLNGPSQWLGRIDAVYVLLRLFSEVYGDHLRQAEEEGLMLSDSAPDIDAELDEFRLNFPDDVLFQGRAYKIHEIHGAARSAIEALTSCFPPILTVALGDFDLTLAKLIRAVRWS